MKKIAVRLSKKLSGAIVAELTSLPDYRAIVETAALTVPMVPRGHGSFIVDDAYLPSARSWRCR